MEKLLIIPTPMTLELFPDYVPPRKAARQTSERDPSRGAGMGSRYQRMYIVQVLMLLVVSAASVSAFSMAGIALFGTPAQRTSRRKAARMHDAVEKCEDKNVARLIESDLVDLHRRLMAAPLEIGAQPPACATKCFSLDRLRGQAAPGAAAGDTAAMQAAVGEAMQLCKELREHHFAIIRLDCAGQTALESAWRASRRFFDMSWQQKLEAAGPHRQAQGKCVCM